MNNENKNTEQESKWTAKHTMTLIQFAVVIAVIIFLFDAIITINQRNKAADHVDDALQAVVDSIMDTGMPEYNPDIDFYALLVNEYGIEGKRVANGLEIPLGYKDFKYNLTCTDFENAITLIAEYSDTTVIAVLDRESGEVMYS